MSPGTCCICGCTETNACIRVHNNQFNCGWYDADRTLCDSSTCVQTVQREQYNRRHEELVAAGSLPGYEELSPEEAAAICTKCGKIADPEMPFDEGDPILCCGDICEEAERQ